MKIQIIAHTNSRKPRIEKDLLENIHVYVAEPPMEGKANHAIVEALADYFSVKKRDVSLISGHTSKQKLFEITNSFGICE